MALAPVIVFCFNRPKHISQTLDALKKCTLAEQTDLYIFSDGPRNETEKVAVAEVRKVISAITGFESITITEREDNFGLAKSIISGVSEVIDKHKKVIVLEDDLICSESFLINKNTMLSYFESYQEVFSTSAFCPPITVPKDFKASLFLYPRISSYGWGTWIDRWQSVDWTMDTFNTFIQSKEKRQQFNRGGIDLSPMLLHQKVGKVNSWAVRFCYASSVQNKMCVYPVESMLAHIGYDGSGTHANANNNFGDSASNKVIQIDAYPEENKLISDQLRSFWRNSPIRRLINWYKRIVYISILKL